MATQSERIAGSGGNAGAVQTYKGRIGLDGNLVSGRAVAGERHKQTSFLKFEQKENAPGQSVVSLGNLLPQILTQAAHSQRHRRLAITKIACVPIPCLCVLGPLDGPQGRQPAKLARSAACRRCLHLARRLTVEQSETVSLRAKPLHFPMLRSFAALQQNQKFSNSTPLKTGAFYSPTIGLGQRAYVLPIQFTRFFCRI